ncbi:MAG: glycosyltransferase family protein [Acidimicrobiales bacterium]
MTRTATAPRVSHRPGWGSLARGAAIVAIYVVCAVIGYWHAWGHPAGVAVGGGAGDQAQTMWYLRWVPWALAHGQNPLFTVWANYPLGVNLLAQTSVLALGLVVAPVTLLWGPVAAFNVSLTAAFVLSAGAAYLLCRRFTSWRPAAFAGGLLYGFSPYMVGQGVGHLNLVFVPIPPLILLALHELMVRQQRSPLRVGVALGALVVVQFFISTEILATTALFAVIAVAMTALLAPGNRWQRLRRAAPGIGIAVAMILVVLAYPIEVLLRGPQHITGSIIGFRYYYSALVAPLLPTPLMIFGTAHLKELGHQLGGNGVENGTYLGVPLVLLVLVAAVLVRRREIRIAAGLALIAFVLSLGRRFHFGLPSMATAGHAILLPGAVIYKVPLLNQAFPVRYSLYVALFVSVVLAGTLDAVHTWSRRHFSVTFGAPLLAGLVAVVALLPLLPAWPYGDQVPTSVPTYFTSKALRSIPSRSVALLYPYANATEAQPQLWQAEADLRFRMPGGYFLVPAGTGRGAAQSTTTPVGTALTAVLDGPAPARTPTLRTALRGELRSWGVQSVVAQPVGHHPIGFLAWIIGRPPDASSGGMYEWYRLHWAG